jgi:hypothetical protein
MLIDVVCTDSSVGGGFPVLACVLSGAGIVLNKLRRSGDGEFDVINTLSCRTNTSQVPMTV